MRQHTPSPPLWVYQGHFNRIMLATPMQHEVLEVRRTDC